jgi:hypothetical protein
MGKKRGFRACFNAVGQQSRQQWVAPVRPSFLKFRQAPIEGAPCSSIGCQPAGYLLAESMPGLGQFLDPVLPRRKRQRGRRDGGPKPPAAAGVTGGLNPRLDGEACAGEDKGPVEVPGLFNGMAIQSDGLSVASSV